MATPPRMVIEVIEDELAAVLRRKTGAERLAIVDRLFRSVRRMIETNIRTSHRGWDDQQVNHEIAARIAGGTH